MPYRGFLEALPKDYGRIDYLKNEAEMSSLIEVVGVVVSVVMVVLSAPYVVAMTLVCWDVWKK